MYNLQNNPTLLPHQVDILKLFFATDFAKPFFITGGTALSAFYLAHRESKDLDLFSLEPYDGFQLGGVIRDIARAVNAQIATRVQSDTYNEIYLENKEKGWMQRIDVVWEQPKRFGDVVDVEGVRVDSFENIGSNKILTVFGRLEIKDYIDLYAIVTETKHTFDELFLLAKQKDLGLNEFSFANIVANAGIEQIETWPRLKTDFDKQGMYAYYTKLVQDLLMKVKPEDK